MDSTDVLTQSEHGDIESGDETLNSNNEQQDAQAKGDEANEAVTMSASMTTTKYLKVQLNITRTSKIRVRQHKHRFFYRSGTVV